MTPAPYYDPGNPEQATRSWLVGHHLRHTLGAPLVKAAERQVRGDVAGRAQYVEAIVDTLVAHCDPRLLAEMLIVDHWDTAMHHARALVRHTDNEFAAIAARLADGEAPPGYVGRRRACDDPQHAEHNAALAVDLRDKHGRCVLCGLVLATTVDGA
jgi:hypothetical protein